MYFLVASLGLIDHSAGSETYSVIFLMLFFLHHHIIFLFSSKTDNDQSISGIISKENKNRVYFMIKKTQRPKWICHVLRWTLIFTLTALRTSCKDVLIYFKFLMIMSSVFFKYML